MNHSLLELIKILIIGGMLGLAIYGGMRSIKIRSCGGLIMFLISFISGFFLLNLFVVKLMLVIPETNIFNGIRDIFSWLMN